ncbi:hypothetical protein [Marinobacter xestospongiae]|uniref:Uncharacterized protein n=1 Tax=Marinobacter xestospongiae TaxID=994319 RepID=A0ABU3VWP4_9GAMM|nr:hypothetical protein [Marinobacter xestospongiae]MDV2078703.1 hypothetical protein [Marinobacter xestospongiae]|tara:strand:- start:822 stop:1259 length:438 start_codon:yes stop_codon:yes gene_type:complete
MNVIIVAASGAVLVGLYRAVMKPNPPQSPAACGTGFFVSTAGVASVLYLLSLIPSSLFYQFASVFVLPLLALIAGYAAARTTEDTSSMNAKIVAGVGLIPYVIICMLFLSSLPSWVLIFAILSFVPCVLIGLRVYQKRSPELENA